MTTKILLHGHYGFANRGCEAIVHGTAKILKQYIPDCDITLFSRMPAYDQKIIDKYNLPITKIVQANLTGKKKPSISWIKQTFYRKVLYPNIGIQDYLHKGHFQENDVIISIGGDNFTDDYNSADSLLKSLLFAKKLNKKTVIWGASIGPFLKNISHRIDILKTVDLITVREDISQKYLEENGIYKNVTRVSDPAFLMSPKRPKTWNDNNNTEIVGIGMSSLFSRYSSKETDYIDNFAKLANYIINEYKTSIMLVPHVIDKSSVYFNDVIACNKVYEKISNKKMAFVLEDNFDAKEIKYCISKCKYFIGARTHSTIASLSCKIPTISVGYSNKAWGINLDILNTDKYVQKYENSDINTLKMLYDDLVINDSKIRHTINENLSSIKTQAMNAGKSLYNLCQK